MRKGSQPSPGPEWEALQVSAEPEDSSQDERGSNSNVASASVRPQKTVHQALKRKERDRLPTNGLKNKRPRHEESTRPEGQTMGRPSLTNSISAPAPSGSAGSSRPSVSALSQAGPSRSSNNTSTAKAPRDRYRHLSVNIDLTINEPSSQKKEKNTTRDFPTSLPSSIFNRAPKSANSVPKKKKPVQSVKSFVGDHEVYEISSDDSAQPPPPVKKKVLLPKSKRTEPTHAPRARKSTGSLKSKPTPKPSAEAPSRKPSPEVIIIEDSDDDGLELSYPSVPPKPVRASVKEPGPSTSASQTSNPQQAYEYPGSEEVQETDHELPLTSPLFPSSPMDEQADQSDHNMRITPEPPLVVLKKQELFSPRVPAEEASSSTSRAVSRSKSPVTTQPSLQPIPTPSPMDTPPPQTFTRIYKTAFKSASRVRERVLSSSPASESSGVPENGASVPASPGSLLEDEIGTLNLSDKVIPVAKLDTTDHPPVVVADKPATPHLNHTPSGSALSEVEASKKQKNFARKTMGNSLVDAINSIHNQHSKSAKGKRKMKPVQSPADQPMVQPTVPERVSQEDTELRKQREKSKLFRNALESRKGKGKAVEGTVSAPLSRLSSVPSTSRAGSDELRLHSPSNAVSTPFKEHISTPSNHHLKSSATSISDYDLAQRPPSSGEASSSTTKLAELSHPPVTMSENTSILAIAQKSPPARQPIRPIDLQMSPERLKSSSQDDMFPSAPDRLPSPKPSVSSSSGAGPSSTFPLMWLKPKMTPNPSPMASLPLSPRLPKPSETHISWVTPYRPQQTSVDTHTTQAFAERTPGTSSTVDFQDNDIDVPRIPLASAFSDTSDDEAMQEVAEVEALIENEARTDQYSDGVDEATIEPPESSSTPSISLPSSSRSSASEPWPGTPDDSEPPACSRGPSSEDTVIRRSKTYGGFLAITMRDHISERTISLQKCRYARDLPHLFHDYVNDMPLYLRMLPEMRKVYEAVIMENTVEDEPDAPPIEIQNEVDDEPTPPWEFYYTNEMWLGDDVPPPDTENLVRCNCKGGCSPKSKDCACLQRQQKEYGEVPVDFAYDKTGKLVRPGYPIFECNDLCGCGDECRNRVVQHGRKVSVAIRKTPTKGWGVFATRKITAGSFIGIYSGELITDVVAHKRGVKYNKFGRTYLFDVDFHHLREGKNDDEWNNSFTVDAYHAGNFTRFLNHSCDPNSRLYPCYINEGNINKPLLVIFSRRDIEANEEICFNYQGSYPDDEDDEDEDETDASDNMEERDLIYMNCMCGAKRCTGKMFK